MDEIVAILKKKKKIDLIDLNERECLRDFEILEALYQALAGLQMVSDQSAKKRNSCRKVARQSTSRSVLTPPGKSTSRKHNTKTC